MSTVESFELPGPEYKTTTTTDGGHAKAELALRFLEFYERAVVVKTFKPEVARRISGRCWVILSEYFQP